MLDITKDNIELNNVIYIDNDNESWIKFTNVDNELLKHANENFDNMTLLVKNDEKSNVMVFNKDTENPEWIEERCHRWHKSYLNTPNFNKSANKSYMFSGNDGSEIEEKLPDVFTPYYNLMKTMNNNYNQVVVNYYEKENDYIPYHRDWTDGMVDNYEISIITLNNEGNDRTRTFEIIPNKDMENAGNKYDKINIELYNGLVLTMGGKFQDKFRHGIMKLSDDNRKENRRMGLTFRQFVE